MLYLCHHLQSNCRQDDAIFDFSLFLTSTTTAMYDSSVPQSRGDATVALDVVVAMAFVPRTSLGGLHGVPEVGHTSYSASVHGGAKASGVGRCTGCVGIPLQLRGAARPAAWEQNLVRRRFMRRRTNLAAGYSPPPVARL